MSRLELGEFRSFNIARSEAPKESGGFGHSLIDWSPAEWGCALAGEVGELCNLLKKMRRGDPVDFYHVMGAGAGIMLVTNIVVLVISWREEKNGDVR